MGKPTKSERRNAPTSIPGFALNDAETSPLGSDWPVKSVGQTPSSGPGNMEIAQRGLRAVFRDSKSTYKELLKKANLKSLYKRRLQDIACMMFKVKHDLCPPSVKNLFSLKSSTYNLRGADFYTPRFNTVTYGKHSLRYIGPTLWNRLSTNLKNLPSLKSFRRQIALTNLSLKIDNECENCILCST